MFEFLEELARNNSKAWFEVNRERYRESVVAPVTDFIVAMGERLPRISPDYVADPRLRGGSLFRIYRDTRFSADKRPYKESVGCQFLHAGKAFAYAEPLMRLITEAIDLPVRM